MKHSSILFLCMSLVLLACNPSRSLVHSIQLNQYAIGTLDSLLKIETRPIALFIHTDWCQYCQGMKQTTLKDPDIIKKLNDHFYFVNFNGEQKGNVQFKKRTYYYIPKGRNSGTHEFANALGTINGELTYPVFLILDSNLEVVFKYNQFITAQELNKILEKFI